MYFLVVETGCLRTAQLDGSSLGGDMDPGCGPFSSCRKSLMPGPGLYPGQGLVHLPNHLSELAEAFPSIASHYCPGIWAEQACDPHLIHEEGGAKRVSSLLKTTSWTVPGLQAAHPVLCPPALCAMRAEHGERSQGITWDSAPHNEM